MARTARPLCRAGSHCAREGANCVEEHFFDRRLDSKPRVETTRQPFAGLAAAPIRMAIHFSLRISRRKTGIRILREHCSLRTAHPGEDERESRQTKARSICLIDLLSQREADWHVHFR